MKKIKELIKKPTKEQINEFLFFIAVVSLFKIAFFGIDSTIDTKRWGSLSVDASVSGSIDVSGNVDADVSGRVVTY